MTANHELLVIIALVATLGLLGAMFMEFHIMPWSIDHCREDMDACRDEYPYLADYVERLDDNGNCDKGVKG